METHYVNQAIKATIFFELTRSLFEKIEFKDRNNGQSLPFKSNKGKLSKFTNRVSKDRMKAKKSKRQSLKQHFYLQV